MSEIPTSGRKLGESRAISSAFRSARRTLSSSNCAVVTVPERLPKLDVIARLAPDDAPEVLTSDGRYCLAGITRANVLEICHAKGIPARETTFSLTDVYAAREAFVTGTFAGVVPVRSVDGRTIGDGRRGPMVERLQALYRELVDADVAARVAQ